jgi:hypothetical protein
MGTTFENQWDKGDVRYSEEKVKFLKSTPNITVEQLDKFVNDYIKCVILTYFIISNKNRAAANGTTGKEGYLDESHYASYYSVSKAAGIALSILQHKILSSDTKRPGIIVNAVFVTRTYAYTNNIYSAVPASLPRI